jgi:HupE / UreJ protein
LSDGGYLVLRFTRHCAEPVRSLTIDYNLLFELDPQHRGLLHVSLGNVVQAAAFSPTHRQQTFEARFAPFETFRQFFLVGVDHLLTGIDHLLFITMLLVPAMFRRDASESPRRSGWIPVPRFGAAFVETIKVLSAFTLAHAMTLTSAVLGYVNIPAQLVESLIALTILATAIDNIRPILPGRRWMLAFAFGLIHGLGFANALGPLALPAGVLALALLSFNLGLEAAQIGIASLTLPFGFAFRNTRSYQAGLLPGASAVVAIIASAWFIDRAGDLGMMPF